MTVTAYRSDCLSLAHRSPFSRRHFLSTGGRWVGRTVQLGTATLRVIKRTVRCEGINVDAKHGTGAADVDVPRLLATHFPEHGAYLGVYAQVVAGGSIHVGDSVLAAPAG